MMLQVGKGMVASTASPTAGDTNLMISDDDGRPLCFCMSERLFHKDHEQQHTSSMCTQLLHMFLDMVVH